MNAYKNFYVQKVFTFENNFTLVACFGALIGRKVTNSLIYVRVFLFDFFFSTKTKIFLPMP